MDGEQQPTEERRFLVIANISKKSNVATLFKAALAFNFVPLVVGMSKIADEIRLPLCDDPAAAAPVRYLKFDRIEECKEFLQGRAVGQPLVLQRSESAGRRGSAPGGSVSVSAEGSAAVAEASVQSLPQWSLAGSQAVPLVGIEIMAESQSLLAEPFREMTGGVALMPGNEGQGLSSTQRAACDASVYIPQYGNGTASLNVTVATTIVLHSYYNACCGRGRGRGSGSEGDRVALDDTL